MNAYDLGDFIVVGERLTHVPLRKFTSHSR